MCSRQGRWNRWERDTCEWIEKYVDCFDGKTWRKETTWIHSSIHPSIHSFILQSVLWQTNRLFQSEFSTAKPSDPSFNFQYPLFSLRSSISCLRLLPRIPITSVFPAIFHSITCFRRQFLHKTWPNHLAFLFFIVDRMKNIKIVLKYIDGGTWTCLLWQ